MKTAFEQTLTDFLEVLASKNPVPGGGGASGLIGAVAAALCSMVANLTSGKKKYAEYQPEIDLILIRTSESIHRLTELIDQDAQVFEPLSAAYGIPRETPGRNELLEQALITACSVPIKLLKELSQMIDMIELLAMKGSRLAISDVGVAASACRCAMESAVMNIYINTRLMSNRAKAGQINQEAEIVFQDGTQRCDAVYRQITELLKHP